jgi:hypothetical protein
MRRTSVLLAISFLFTAGYAAAKPKPKPKKTASGPVGHASKETARAIDELQGKFKWGMTREELQKTLDDEIHKQFAEDWKKAVGKPAEQDAINAKIRDRLSRIDKTFVEFKGQKTSWEVSIIDREFAPGNEESMIYIDEGERKQRRYLFFWQNKLYKQMIAFDADLFQGKSFDDFAGIIQGRYGRGQAKYKLNRKGEQELQHLEWPPSGTTILRAVDQSGFFHTFCLVIEDKNVSGIVAPKHKENALVGSEAGGLVGEITRPEKVSGDSNSDIVDQITGRGKGASSSEEPVHVSEPSKLNPEPTPAASKHDEPLTPTPAPEKKKAPAKKDKKGLDDLEL